MIVDALECMQVDDDIDQRVDVGDGGAIALDKDGNVFMPFNTEGMYRGWIKPDGERGVAIFKD